MATERVPVDTRMETTLLRPAARTVDTFVAPGPSPLRGLADALSKIDAPLQRYLAAKDKKTADADKIRGEAEGLKSNGEGWAEAVASGRAPANSSKHFQDGYKNSQGIVAGQALPSAFDAAFDEWEGKNSDDPAAFDSFMTDFIQKNIQTDDPEVLRGLVPQVRELHAHGYAKYQTYRHEQVYNGALNTAAAGISGDIDTAIEDGLSDPDGADYSAVNVRVNAWRENLVKMGTNPLDADKAVMNAVAAKALQMRDPALLTWFNEKVPGKDYTYGDTPAGLELRTTTSAAIDQIKKTELNEGYTQQQRIDKVESDKAIASIQDVLAKEGPAAVIPDDVMAAAKKYIPTIETDLAGWRTDLNRGFTEKSKLDAVYDEIINGGGVGAVLKAQRLGVFGTIDDLREATAYAKSLEESKQGVEDIIKDASTQDLFKDFDILLKGKNDDGDPIAGRSREAMAAQYDLQRGLTEWVMKNPDATYMEKQEAISKMGKVIRDRIVEGDPYGIGEEAAGQYKRGGPNDQPAFPWDNRWDNPAPDPAALGVEPEPPAATDPETTKSVAPEQRSEADIPVPGEEETDFLNGMEAPQRASFDARAAELGMTPEELAAQTLGPAVKPEAFAGGTAKMITGPAKLAASAYNALTGGASEEDKGSEPRGKGMAALVTSNKRGYTPDTENLRPKVREGVTTLQASFGKDLPIVSGYRDPGRNKKAGGAKKSQHMHGNAVDIDVSEMPKEERLRLIKLASEQGFTGIGVYDNSLHLDYGGRRSWGPSHSKDSIPGWAQAAIGEHLGRKTPETRETRGMAKAAGTALTREQAEEFLQDALSGAPMDLAFEGSADPADFEGDETAARVLNLIGNHEGGGNWNAIAGNAGSTRDLSGYTLDQIIATQTSARRRGVASTAIGKYQFLRDTLKGLKGTLGLTGKEKFTPKLQNQLAYGLLERRGYSQWKAGKLSDRAFALRLSQEWAALENPNTGRSYYDWVGNNRASVRVTQVYDALGI